MAAQMCIFEVVTSSAMNPLSSFFAGGGGRAGFGAATRTQCHGKTVGVARLFCVITNGRRTAGAGMHQAWFMRMTAISQDGLMRTQECDANQVVTNKSLPQLWLSYLLTTVLYMEENVECIGLTWRHPPGETKHADQACGQSRTDTNSCSAGPHPHARRQPHVWLRARYNTTGMFGRVNPGARGIMTVFQSPHFPFFPGSVEVVSPPRLLQPPLAEWIRRGQPAAGLSRAARDMQESHGLTSLLCTVPILNSCMHLRARTSWSHLPIVSCLGALVDGFFLLVLAVSR
eukprot:357311-Chlamydomonas_euryale.AAC.1